jgi:hypothetical protein
MPSTDRQRSCSQEKDFDPLSNKSKQICLFIGQGEYNHIFLALQHFVSILIVRLSDILNCSLSSLSKVTLCITSYPNPRSYLVCACGASKWPHRTAVRRRSFSSSPILLFPHYDKGGPRSRWIVKSIAQQYPSRSRRPSSLKMIPSPSNSFRWVFNPPTV